MHAILTSPAFPPREDQQGRAAATAQRTHIAVAPAIRVEAPVKPARAPRTLAEVCARHLRKGPAAEQPKRKSIRHEGNPIRHARKKHGLTLEGLAKRLGVTQSCVHYWEIDGNFVGVDRLRELRAVLAPHFDLEAYLAHVERVGRTRVRAERGR